MGRKKFFRAGVSGRHVHELSMDQEGMFTELTLVITRRPKTCQQRWQMTPDGKFTYLLEKTEHPPRGISIWRDSAGHMYFVDQNNHTKTRTLLCAGILTQRYYVAGRPMATRMAMARLPTSVALAGWPLGRRRLYLATVLGAAGFDGGTVNYDSHGSQLQNSPRISRPCLAAANGNLAGLTVALMARGGCGQSPPP